MRKLTTREFIHNAKQVHGDVYDYSESVYLGNKKPVKILCKVHGVFMQAPNGHVAGKQGCPRCSRRDILNTENFTHHAKNIHKGKYGYQFVECSKSTDTVVIVCPKHGSFTQTVMAHISGHGCSKCASEMSALARLNDADSVLERMKNAHGGVYEYGNFVYCGSNRKSWITCRVHGDFEQTPKEHIRGRGCKKCAKNFKMDRKLFADKSNRVHNHIYTYDKVQYVNVSTPVIITCKVHGDFIQKPSDHLSGHGCQQCASGGFKPHLRGYLYMLKSESAYKIGISNKPLKRFSDLRYETPFDFRLEACWQHDIGMAVACAEKLIKNSCERSGFTGFSGATEWFKHTSSFISSVDSAVHMFGLSVCDVGELS